jgi:hypothetical protein
MSEISAGRTDPLRKLSWLIILGANVGVVLLIASQTSWLGAIGAALCGLNLGLVLMACPE